MLSARANEPGETRSIHVTLKPTNPGYWSAAVGKTVQDQASFDTVGAR